MVHLEPDEGVGVGPIVVQEIVPINPEDSLDDLEERIQSGAQAVRAGVMQAAVRLIQAPP